MTSSFDGAIGIDLGTTYSCVAVFIHDHVEVIANDQGNRTTPSCVAFHNDEILVGDSAKNLVTRGAANVIYDAKRMIGHRFSDKVVQEDRARWPFVLQSGENDKIEIEVEFKGEKLRLAPEQISAYVLSYLKACAEKFLAQTVHHAVITVPAYFNDAQRERTKAAAAIAGLNAIRIVNEPTAAALCYGLGLASTAQPTSQHLTSNPLYQSISPSKLSTSSSANVLSTHDERNSLSSTATDSCTTPELRNIVVFDLGGGTFDVSVITVDEGSFAVRSTAGDTHLGGQDIDANLLEYVLRDVEKRFAINLRSLPRQLAKAKAACERVKRTLSHATSDELILDGLLPDGEDYVLPFSRAKLEELNSKLFDKCMNVVKKALHDASLTSEEIHSVILVGGSSRIPRLHALLAQQFTPNKLCSSVHPDEAVAIGAAIQASILSSSPIQQSDKTSHVVLMDVVPLSIGVEIDDGKLDVIIPRNTTIPYRATKEYSTVQDNQQDVDIVVFEGERSQTRHCHKLGEFALEGITRAKKGDPTITVTFSIDADGLLTITASEELAQMTKTLTVQNSERLSEEEVKKMISEAQRLRTSENDNMTVEKAETLLESALHDLESIVAHNNLGGEGNECSLPDDKKEVCEKLLRHVREWIKRRLPLYASDKDNHNESKTKELKKKVEKIIKRIHQASKLATRHTRTGITGNTKAPREHDKQQTVKRVKTEAVTEDNHKSDESNKENCNENEMNIRNSDHEKKNDNDNRIDKTVSMNDTKVGNADDNKDDDNNNDENNSDMSDLASDAEDNANNNVDAENIVHSENTMR